MAECKNRSTHHGGCECHEARRDAELAAAVARAERVESENDSLRLLAEASTQYALKWQLAHETDTGQLSVELAALKEKIEGVREAHTCIDLRESECDICGALDCPKAEPLHYHHDGCPSCEADNG